MGRLLDSTLINNENINNVKNFIFYLSSISLFMHRDDELIFGVSKLTRHLTKSI